MLKKEEEEKNKRKTNSAICFATLFVTVAALNELISRLILFYSPAGGPADG